LLLLMTDVPTSKKNLADGVDIYGRGRELFRPPTYIPTTTTTHITSTCDVTEPRELFNKDSGRTGRKTKSPPLEFV
jgi:hypothetical protein